MTLFGRNFFCWAMSITAWIWSSVACSSRQNASGRSQTLRGGHAFPEPGESAMVSVIC